jgi:hypothetical protein
MNDQPTPQTDQRIQMLKEGHSNCLPKWEDFARGLERQIPKPRNTAIGEQPTPETDKEIEKHGDEFTGHMAREFARALERQRDKNRRLYETECKDHAFLLRTHKKVIAERDEARRELAEAWQLINRMVTAESSVKSTLLLEWLKRNEGVKNNL